MNGVLKDSIDIVAGVSIIFGVIFSYIQIRKISKSIEISQKSNLINVISYFNKEYDSIMSELKECASQSKMDSWYFRFWNLLTNEFMFFDKKLLDPFIFELWTLKICSIYDKKPSDFPDLITTASFGDFSANIPSFKIDTFRENHKKYLKCHLEDYPKAKSFFARMIKISEENKIDIKAPVHKLIKEFKKLEWA